MFLIAFPKRGSATAAYSAAHGCAGEVSKRFEDAWPRSSQDVADIGVHQQRLGAGEMVQIDVPGLAESNPWSRFAGIWKDHPDLEGYRENIVEYRRQVDEDWS